MEKDKALQVSLDPAHMSSNFFFLDIQEFHVTFVTILVLHIDMCTINGVMSVQS